MDTDNTSNININNNSNNSTNVWGSDIESILEKIRVNSVILSKAHKREYHKLKHLLTYFRIPIIIFSAFNSVMSVGLQPYITQGIISVSTCLISLIIGVISSIELYLSIQTTMELELSVSKDYYTLSVNIYKMLQLDRNNRNTDSHSFLDQNYGEYLKLFEKSNLLKKRITDDLTPLPSVKKGGILSSLSISIPETPSEESSEV